jgi:hypothetical protein
MSTIRSTHRPARRRRSKAPSKKRKRTIKRQAPPQDFSNAGAALIYGMTGAVGGMWPVGGCGTNVVGAMGAGFELGGGHFHGSILKKAKWMSAGAATGVALNLLGTMFAPATGGLSLLPSGLFGAISFGIAGAAQMQ